MHEYLRHSIIVCKKNMNLRAQSCGGVAHFEEKEEANPPSAGLNQGKTKSYSLSGSILTNNQCERLVKLNDSVIFGPEGANASNQKLFERGHSKVGVNAYFVRFLSGSSPLPAITAGRRRRGFVGR